MKRRPSPATRTAPLTLFLLFSFLVPAAAVAAGSPVGLSKAAGPLEAVQRLTLPSVDLDWAAAEDAERARQGLAPRYALPVPVSKTPATAGTWETLKSGDRLWRLRVLSQGASTLNFGFKKFLMPAGGRLFVYTPDGSAVRGPYTDKDNEKHGELWTPVIPGEEAVIELLVPERMRPFLELELASVNHGYKTFWVSPAVKSGSCNVDVVCPEGDGWRDEIRSVAVISTGGSTFCSGFLVNNTAQDNKPYFMTANHCGITAANAASLVVYWNYETSTCGGWPDGTLDQYQSGSYFRAARAASDFTLVELDDDPAEAFNVHWTGWDNSSADPVSATAIHHPSTDEKRISFEFDPLTTTSYLAAASPGDGTHLRVADWDVGTTEPGSSGSGLWNQDHRIVGQLHGGHAACGNDLADWYGRFSVSWNAGATPSTRLKDWLDPLDTGAVTLDGIDQCPRPIVDFTVLPNPAEVGETVSFESTVTEGLPPYGYEWDLDGDGVVDCTTPECDRAYSSPFNGSVKLTVTDSLPCKAVRVRHLAVGYPCVDEDGDGYGSPASPFCPYPQADCDDSNPNVNPGMPENCSNGIDDNCNGLVDSADPACASPGWGSASVIQAGAPGGGERVGATTAGGASWGPLAMVLLPLALVAIWKVRRRFR